MIKFLALSDWPLWVVIPILQTIFLFNLIINRIAPRLIIIRFYLIYSILADAWLMVTAFLLSSHFYWHTYWIMQSFGYLFQIGISLALLNTLRTGRTSARIVISCTSLAMLLLACIHAVGHNDWTTWINLFRWSDTAIWFILLLSILFSDRWVWPYKGIAAGLALGIWIHFICSFVQGYSDPGPLLRFFYQFGSLAGLSVWMWNVNKNRRLPVLTAHI